MPDVDVYPVERPRVAGQSETTGLKTRAVRRTLRRTERLPQVGTHEDVRGAYVNAFGMVTPLGRQQLGDETPLRIDVARARTHAPQ